MRISQIEVLEGRIAPANLAFAIGMGGAKDDSVQDLGVDAAGNTYISGDFGGTVDFDPGPGVVSKTVPGTGLYGYVAKYTSTGALAWVDVIQYSDRDASDIHLAVTPAGDVYVSGEFGGAGTTLQLLGTGTPPPPLSLIGGNDLFVAKLQTDGRVMWAQAYGTANPVAVEEDDIATDGVGGVYVVGSMRANGVNSSIDFGTGALNARAGDDNLYVLKLNDTGLAPVVAWANSTTSTGANPSGIQNPFIAVDAAGQVGVAGKFAEQITFQTGVPVVLTDAQDGIFVARLSAAGAWTVAGQFGGNDTDRAVTGVAMDSASHLFVAGIFSAATDFDIGAGVSSIAPGPIREGFIARYGPSGSLDFVRNRIPANGEMDAGVVAVDAAGNAYVTFDDTHPFLVRADSVGNLDTLLDLPGLNGNDGLPGLAVDSSGGIHLASGFTGSADFDPTPSKFTLTSKGKSDIFIASYFPANSFLVGQDLQPGYVTKSFTIGGAGDEIGRQLLTDAAGNTYVAGVFNGTVDFDPGPGVTNLTSKNGAGFNIFVAKYDPAGTLVWAQPVLMDWLNGENPNGPGVRMALDAAGNVYLTGQFHGQATLGAFTITNADPPGGPSISDLFVAKLDSSGSFQWAYDLPDAGFSEGISSLVVRPSTGQMVLGGFFTNTIDVDPGAGVVSVNAVNGQSSFDSFILSLDTGGTFQWVRHLGGNFALNFVNGLALTSAGDVVATGAFNNTVDFNLGGAPVTLTGESNNDIFVARFAGATGNVVWAKSVGGVLADSGNAVVVGAGDTIFVGGDFQGSVDFDPGAGTALRVEAGGGQGDAFLLQLASNGTFLNAAAFGGPRGDTVSRLIINAPGSLMVIGNGGGDMDFDPGVSVAKLTTVTPYVAHFNGSLQFLTARALPGNAATVDAQGNVFVTGSFTGTADLDPSATKATFKSAGGKDLFVVSMAPDNVFDAEHPRTFHDFDGDVVTLQITGPGTGVFSLEGGATHMNNLAELDLAGTNLTTTVSVNVAKFGLGDGGSFAGKILTTQANQHIGSILVSSKVTFGDGAADIDADLHVSGKLNKLVLGDIQGGTLIRLGDGLPYNVLTDTTTPDTYNNHPDITMGEIMGDGVQLNVLGDGGIGENSVGGGGLGNVIIGSWTHPGFIRTTQSVGDITVLDGDFYARLEIDKFHRGASTQANCGTIRINNGAYAPSNSEIENNVESFDAKGFLDGATLTAGSIGGVTVRGSFDGEIVLTNPDAPSIPTFQVNTNYTGVVTSAASIKKLKINGDFTGSLKAPSIGSITAFSFIGTHDGMGDPITYIKATAGGLGSLTSSHGPISDFELVTPLVFGGLKVNLSKLTHDTVGIDNVHITAASIGNISVTLKADAKAGEIGLVGIADSDFIATATGHTKAEAGNIGTVTVNITGVPAMAGAAGIQETNFLALKGSFAAPTSTINAIGNINVKLAGSGGSSVGLDGVTFAANNIGTTTVNVTRPTKVANTNAYGMDTVDYTASGTIGAISVSGTATQTQVYGLSVLAGKSIGNVTVKSTDNLAGAFGTLESSDILAGQLLAFTADTAAEQTAALGLAKLGNISLSGSLDDSWLVAGGSIGAVSVGKNATDSLVLAGAVLGGDFTIEGDETYQRVAKIASVTVKGSLERTSIVAGISAGGDHIFGTSDDALAAVNSLVTGSSSIGAITVGIGTINTTSGITHHYAIEASAITSVKAGAVSSKTFPLSLDQGPAGDDASDIVVRVFNPEVI